MIRLKKSLTAEFTEGTERHSSKAAASETCPTSVGLLLAKLWDGPPLRRASNLTATWLLRFLSVVKFFNVLVFLAVLAGDCYTTEPKQIFLDANRLYEEKKFDSAIEKYELIKGVTQSPAVYYNLANSYFRINKIGKAILNYERALKLSPRDEDINLNLKFAKKVLNISQPQGVIKSVHNFFTPFELFLTVFSINCLFFALLYFRFIKNIAIPLTTLLVVFSVLFTSFAILCLKISDDNSPYAIVTASVCEIKSGPGEEYKTKLTLNEGMKLLITAQRNDWCGVKIDRHIGWANRDALERI